MMDYRAVKKMHKQLAGLSCKRLAAGFLLLFLCLQKCIEEGEKMMDFAAIYNIVMTVAIGFIGWSLRELYSKSEKRQDDADEGIEKLNESLGEWQQKLYRDFVTKDDHYRDINALEKKIDNIKDILMGIKEDIGQLTGKGEPR